MSATEPVSGGWKPAEVARLAKRRTAPKGEVMAPGRGRPRQQFSREPDNANDARKMRAAWASAKANSVKIAEISHMLDLAHRERGRILVRASESGVTNAELARIYGFTISRIGQMIKAERDQKS